MTMFTVRLYEGVWLGSLVLVREGDGKVEGWEVAYRQEMGRGIDDMLIMWRGGTHACCEGDELPPGNLDDVLDGTLYDEVAYVDVHGNTYIRTSNLGVAAQRYLYRGSDSYHTMIDPRDGLRMMADLHDNRGMTWEEIAIGIGVSRRAIQAWRAGDYDPSQYHLRSLMQLTARREPNDTYEGIE